MRRSLLFHLLEMLFILILCLSCLLPHPSIVTAHCVLDNPWPYWLVCDAWAWDIGFSPDIALLSSWAKSCGCWFEQCNFAIINYLLLVTFCTLLAEEMLGTDLLASPLQCASYCKHVLLLSWRYSNLELAWASWIMCSTLHESLTAALSWKCCLPGQWLIPGHRLFLSFFFLLAFKLQYNDSCYLTMVCNPIYLG